MSTKRLWSVAAFLLPVFLLAGGPAFGAGTATLLRDIQPVLGGPSWSAGVSGAPLSLGRVALLPVTEPSSGNELWVSDGTDAGTRPLLDLCPGECSSSFSFLGTAGSTGVIRFGRDSRVAPFWRSDGTRAGTFPLQSPTGAPRVCETGPQSALSNGPTLFFTAQVGDVCGVWITDGTSAGTRPLGAFTAGGELDGINLLAAVGRRVFFLVSMLRGDWTTTLWTSDGTPEGTLPLHVWDSQGPSHLTAAGSRLFFIAPDGEDGGREVWISDGTPAGTRPVSRFDSTDPFVPRASYGLVVQAVEDQLCFLANEGAAGRELWCSDGTRPGTRRMTNFSLVSPFVDLDHWRVEKLGQRLVFPANDGTSGNRLWTTPWTTAGQPASTARLESCPEGCPEVAPGKELARVGSRVFFVGNRAGNQLWASDGTGAGTRQVHRACADDCDIARLRPVSGKLYFVASEPSGERWQWATDGSAAGTRRLVEIESLQVTPVPVGDRVLLSLIDVSPELGDLWVTDGTPEGTSEVTRIGQSGDSSSPRQLVPAGDGVRFLAFGEGRLDLWSSRGTPETTNLAVPQFPVERLVGFGNLTLGFDSFGDGSLWRSDGTSEGTFRLFFAEGRRVAEAVALPSRVVFAVTSSEAPHFELWQTNGTVEGTGKVAEVPDGFYAGSLEELGGRAYFVSSQGGVYEQKLWETDGTAAGTRPLTMREGLSIEHPLRLARLGSAVFFVGDDDHFNQEIWRADGTPDGTRALTEGITGSPTDVVAHGGQLYFLARLGAAPEVGLWKSDGTEAGTVLLAVPHLLGQDEPARFTSLGAHLYFFSTDELWRTDGTAQGTTLVRDIVPGERARAPEEVAILGGRLYFSAADPAHGDELWESDGTEAGTRPVHDIAPGPLSSHPEELVASGGKLFFTADDGVHGREPWVYVPTGSGCTPSERALCLGGRFRVEADWRDFEGGSGRGTAVALTGDTGTFWFFDPSNVEVILKVLDGQGLNGHHWVFYGALSSVEYTLTVTDTQTGAVRRYINPPGVLGSVADTQAFGPLGAILPGVGTTGPAPVGSNAPRMGLRKAVAEGSCTPDPTRLCLNDGRFAVEARWKDFEGNTGTGKAVPLAGGDTGYFWFFDASNVEVLLKVLDGRPLNGKFWVFYGALSSVEYTLTVTDTVTGTVKTYTNPSGKLASVADTGAF
jgi:ELWxxDGT repeat protein